MESHVNETETVPVFLARCLLGGGAVGSFLKQKSFNIAVTRSDAS